MVEADGYVEGAFNAWDMVPVALGWGIDFKLADWRQQFGICIGLAGCVRRLALCSCVVDGLVQDCYVGPGLVDCCRIFIDFADWNAELMSHWQTGQ